MGVPIGALVKRAPWLTTRWFSSDIGSKNSTQAAVRVQGWDRRPIPHFSATRLLIEAVNNPKICPGRRFFECKVGSREWRPRPVQQGGGKAIMLSKRPPVTFGTHHLWVITPATACRKLKCLQMLAGGSFDRFRIVAQQSQSLENAVERRTETPIVSSLASPDVPLVMSCLGENDSFEKIEDLAPSGDSVTARNHQIPLHPSNVEVTIMKPDQRRSALLSSRGTSAHQYRPSNEHRRVPNVCITYLSNSARHLLMNSCRL